MKRLVLLIAFLLMIGWSYAQTNYAATFTGSNYATLPISAAFDFSTGTVEMWVKPSTTGQGFVLAMRNSDVRWACFISNTQICLATGDATAAANRKYNFTFVPGTWYHLAYVFKSNGTDMYVNGNKIGASPAIQRTAITGQTLTIGAYGTGLEAFKGAIDEVKVWNVERTQEQIQATMYTTLTLPQTGLVGYWNFDDMGASATMTADLSGNGRPATFNVATSTEIPVLGTITTSSGRNAIPVGSLEDITVIPSTSPTYASSSTYTVDLYAGDTKVGSVSTSPYTFNAIAVNAGVYSAKITNSLGQIATVKGFEGVLTTNTINYAIQAEGITVPSNSTFNLANGGTISVWANPSIATGNMTLVSAQDVNFKATYCFMLNMNNKTLSNYTTINGTSAEGTKFTYPFEVGKWYHFAFVASEPTSTTSKVKAYINGQYIGDFGRNIGGPYATDIDKSLQLGAARSNWGDPVVGSIDEVKIWSVKKTDQDIADIYNGKHTDVTGLEGYWNFNDLATVATDLSGNGRNGTYNKKVYVKMPAPVIRTANVTFTPAATIGFSVDAQTTAGSVTKIDVYNGSTIIGTSTTSPYSFNYTNVTINNTYNFTAVATDNFGNTNTSAITTIVVVNKVPTITALTVAGVGTATSLDSRYPATITTTATDADGAVSSVELYMNGTKFNVQTSSPYTFNLAPQAAGIYTFSAVAYDNVGASATTANFIVTVKTAPTATINASATNPSYTNPSLIYLETAVATNGANVSNVKFYDGVTLLGTAAIVSTGVYSFNWTSNFVIGNRSITAVITDAGTLMGTSAAINVNITTQAPTATITGTDATATIKAPASFTVTASATDPDGTISKIMFYDGATYLGHTLSIGTQAVGATTIYTFQANGINSGIRNLTAVAVDNYGAMGTSAIYTVNVVPNALPTVSLNVTPSTATIKENIAISISGTANDSDDGLNKIVIFKNGNIYTTNIVNATAGTATTYGFNLGTLTAGVYTFSAVAYDELGATNTSTASFTVVALVKPTISITAPTNNTVVTGTLTTSITATANDTDGTVSKVVLYNGTTNVGELTTATSYVFNNIAISLGNNSFTAVAFDNDNASVTSAPIVVIGNTAPTVSITSTTPTTTTQGSLITITVNAGDNGTFSVKLSDNGTPFGDALTTSPAVFTTSTLSTGTHILTAVATDNNGATATSNAVTVIITPAVVVENVKPVVTLTSSKLGNTVTLTATATDVDGSVSTVIFYEGATKLGETVSTTSIYTFQVSNATVGAHNYTAIAVDNLGATGTSTLSTVTIVSVENQVSNLTIKYYPNPTQTTVNVELQGAFEYTILTVGGSVVEKGQARDKAEVASKLQAGFYLLNVNQNGASKTVKIEKQ